MATGYQAAGQPGYPPAGQPGYPAAGQPGYPAAGQPGYPAAGQPGYPAAGQPAAGQPAAGQPGYPAAGQPGYPAAGQPGYPAAGQPGYPAAGQPAAGQPGYPAAGQPGYPAAGQPAAGQPVQGAQPSAPTFDTIGGYENTVGLDSVAVGPPPAYVPAGQPQERPEERYDQNASITDNEAKDALIEFVSQDCCYGKKPANDLEVVDLKPSSAYHYVMESFVESRRTNWAQEPYRGQAIDGPMNGPAPGPWTISIQVPPMFQAQEVQTEVPHTATVKPCPSCFGSGSKMCHRCHGHGRESCTFCHGNGQTHHSATETEAERWETCNSCHGHGDKSCFTCHGTGRVTCTTCSGHRQVKTFIRMTVTWQIKTDQHVVEKTALPNELVSTVSGVQLFAQELPMVFPLTSFFDPEINQASQRLVQAHSQLSNTSRIHMQRHNLRAVPVNEVEGEWSDKRYRFWVYGLEHKVHCPDYPQKCCCGCTII